MDNGRHHLRTVVIAAAMTIVAFGPTSAMGQVETDWLTNGHSPCSGKDIDPGFNATFEDRSNDAGFVAEFEVPAIDEGFSPAPFCPIEDAPSENEPEGLERLLRGIKAF